MSKNTVVLINQSRTTPHCVKGELYVSRRNRTAQYWGCLHHEVRRAAITPGSVPLTVTLYTHRWSLPRSSAGPYIYQCHSLQCSLSSIRPLGIIYYPSAVFLACRHDIVCGLLALSHSIWRIISDMCYREQNFKWIKIRSSRTRVALDPKNRPIANRQTIRSLLQHPHTVN